MNKLKKSFVGLGLLLTSSVSLSAVSCFNNFDFLADEQVEAIVILLMLTNQYKKQFMMATSVYKLDILKTKMEKFKYHNLKKM
ncbi:hypothetical protein [Mycoplasmopsis agalactiae]|uniref:hypothetical protein n=1 Tax=Mycoplasmopsis agalactiae TaxID=2110 RepID=UPI001F3EEF00|nr:hypothetical protein [Mycoplasmopsis agalactiae]